MPSHFLPARRAWRVAVLAGVLCAQAARGEPVSRTTTLQIAETFIQQRWTAAEKNVRHGRDTAGVEIHTPDLETGRGSPAQDCWRVGQENIGVAYKWGGFDTPQSFTAGVRSGRAAGDIYTLEKRRLGGAAVSGAAVGIDCSGFISRCWKLPKKESTSTLAGICRPLPSTADLQPADIMNTGGGHVLLFVRWTRADKSRALFYEAAPFSKTRAAEREIADMRVAGYQPLRYRLIKD